MCKHKKRIRKVIAGTFNNKLIRANVEQKTSYESNVTVS